GGEADRERPTDAHAAGDRDLAAVVAADVLDDREAEPGATGRARPRGVGAIEALEDPCLVTAVYADAFICDSDLDRVGTTVYADRHARAGRAVGNGVLEQVAESGDE